MSLNPKDMDFLEGKHSAARDIALAFGVPPQLLGIPGDSDLRELRAGQAGVLDRHRAAAAAAGILDGFNRWLTPLYGEDLYLWYDEEMIPALEPLRKEKADRHQRGQVHDDQREARGDGLDDVERRDVGARCQSSDDPAGPGRGDGPARAGKPGGRDEDGRRGRRRMTG